MAKLTIHNPQQQKRALRAAGAQRAVFFWHGWSALMIAPVLLVLVVTGCAYLFDREFDQWWQKDAYQVKPQGTVATLAQQQDYLRQQYPAWTINRVMLAQAPTQAVRWQLTAPDGVHLIYLDPYRLVVQADIDPTTQPMAIVRRLHGELMAGTTGGYIVEWMSCWTLFLLLTGGWLWWPKHWRLAGVLVPRKRSDGRVHWRDWHAVLALISSLALAFLVLSGMPWSTFWGKQFAQLGRDFSTEWHWVTPSPNFHLPDTVKSRAVDPHHEHQEHAATDSAAVHITGGTESWVTQQHSAPQAAHPHHSKLHELTSQPQQADVSKAEAYLTRLALETYGPGVRIFYPATDKDVFKINYVPDKAEGQQTLYIDPASGELLDDIGWLRYSALAKVVEWGTMTHLGRQYGVWNQWLNLLFCLLVLAALIAALTLWWRRRKPGRWLPPLQSTDSLPLALKLSLLALVVLFPLLLLSLLAFVVCKFWQRRGAVE
ncbi:PepSY domain-containing protein [Rheinheimera sp. 1928-s]|uniref:PepSY-associated TM helix domain-containing protein n=1 Tax=Rheinheimera sp. 1928-s TaxID=3033803 RepID=UPI002607C9C1|nr:PepSY domain-containing protein [Rheinheimera sp. 1928-s]MDF3126457.1 PepSY domain-containing protein [Rheinheimera sp. 1928-s]